MYIHTMHTCLNIHTYIHSLIVNHIWFSEIRYTYDEYISKESAELFRPLPRFAHLTDVSVFFCSDSDSDLGAWPFRGTCGSAAYV